MLGYCMPTRRASSGWVQPFFSLAWIKRGATGAERLLFSSLSEMSEESETENDTDPPLEFFHQVIRQDTNFAAEGFVGNGDELT
jgi:hypothetical protein